jgi:integrase
VSPIMQATAARPLTSDQIDTIPRPPSIIHYEDDYDDTIRSIKTSECESGVEIWSSGERKHLNFERIDADVRPIVRAYIFSCLQELAPLSAIKYYNLLSTISAADTYFMATASPIDARAYWSNLVARYSYEALSTLKGLLRFLCRINFSKWTSIHVDFVATALSISGPDPYAVVRSGECFITTQEEAKIVRWIDDVAIIANKSSLQALELAAMVICSYQFGMRPKQLGMLRLRDCSIRLSEEDGSSIVHLTFKMIKQRDAMLAKLPLVRKVKREWAPVFLNLLKHKDTENSANFLFGFKSRLELSAAFKKILGTIVPGGDITAYDLRHSLAQRLVDSGASQEELASALGHSTLSVGLVYFRSSANQAELVNKALGASTLYRKISKIADEKFISPEDMAALRGDMQIAGVPHGIPIAGIGGCQTGQPSCQFNPVTACYGCPKFMPVRTVSVHQQVLKEFRSVVLFYKDSGHGEMQSPAYLQLQRTISEVQNVIHQLAG